jgi:hypothetical protein
MPDKLLPINRLDGIPGGRGQEKMDALLLPVEVVNADGKSPEMDMQLFVFHFIVRYFLKKLLNFMV